MDRILIVTDENDISSQIVTEYIRYFGFSVKHLLLLMVKVSNLDQVYS